MRRVYYVLIIALLLFVGVIGEAAARDGRTGPLGRVWRDMTAAPAVTDDTSKGYRVLDVWEYANTVYVCTDATVGAAIWRHTGDSTATTIAANAVHTTADLGQQYNVGVYVVRLPNPSTSSPPLGTITVYNCTGAGCTLFVTSGSIRDSGTTIWTTSLGAAAMLTYSSVSAFVTPLSGSWTRF